MSQDPKFTHYRSMVSRLAQRGLDAAPAMAPTESLLMALPAARLLLGDDPSQHAGLVRAMQRLADIGRPWLRVGVNVGTLAAPVDDPQHFAAQDEADRLLRRYARSAAVSTDATPPPGFPVPLPDPAGHVRDIYHPLAVHLCLAAFHRCYETVPQALWGKAEQALLEMVAPLRFIEYFADAPPPPALVPLVLWQALGVAGQSKLLSRDVDLELVDVVVQVIVNDAPDEDDPASVRGALHRMHENDTLDTWTYRELASLHALANLALRRRNSAWARRVADVAAFHREHTQPDNATTQPWGLFAFLWSPGTRDFAEQQIHDLTAHGGGIPNPLAAMLLADAADCLVEFG